jgi:hypothetical protein
MYPWIWRHLPGNTAARSVGALILLIAVLALLFLVVFPWVEPRVPFNDVTVDTGGEPATGATTSPAP